MKYFGYFVTESVVITSGMCPTADLRQMVRDDLVPQPDVAGFRSWTDW